MYLLLDRGNNYYQRELIDVKICVILLKFWAFSILYNVILFIIDKIIKIFVTSPKISKNNKPIP